MRILLTGVDDQGRSCVVAETAGAPDAFGGGGITVTRVASTQTSPPSPRPPGRAEGIDVAAAPGVANWSIIDFPPGVVTPMHHTDSLDFDVVLEGEVDLILDDGPHRLGPGDGAVIAGVDHAWQTHDVGCRTSVIVIGTPPLD